MDRVVVAFSCAIVAAIVIIPITVLIWFIPILHRLWVETIGQIPPPDGVGMIVVYVLIAAAVAGVIWKK